MTVPRRVAFAVAAMALSAAGLAFAPPVLLSVSPDPTELRPRNYCLMNPLRDRAPERAASRVLQELKAGRVEAVAPLVAQDQRTRIVENERAWPIESWRIGRREEKGADTELMFWVKRGNGYSRDGYEESVSFVIRTHPQRGAEVIRFGAVY